MNKIHLGTLIKDKLVERGMSVKAFAERIDCDRTTVYDIFKRKSLDIDQLLRISRALDFDFIHEVYRQRNPTPKKFRNVLVAIPINAELLEKMEIEGNFINLTTESDSSILRQIHF